MPPEVKWDSQAVKKDLCRAKFDAHVVEGRVRFEIAEPADPRVVQFFKDLASQWKKIAPSSTDIFPQTIFAGPLKVTIFHDANRFIRNVKLEYELWKCRWDNGRELVEGILLHHECLKLNDEVESAIVRRYCTVTAAIESLETEIARLRQSKETFVEAQDFEAAAKRRNDEHEAFRRLDDLVKHAAQGIAASRSNQ